MANSILIMGESGTGKSTSLRNLDPKETFIINVLNKPLPFKNFAKNYIYLSKDGGSGNYFSSDNSLDILKVLNKINNDRHDIKNVVIDDFQYVMANCFMRRAKEKGYEKFTEIGKSAWEIINSCASSDRGDLYFFILSHTELDASGKFKCKTIGKMLDDKITLEGMFTVVFHSIVVDNSYKFITQNDGVHVAKSPMGMFDDKLIDNDILSIKSKMSEYFGDDDNFVKIPSKLPDYEIEILAAASEDDLIDIYKKSRLECPNISNDVAKLCAERKANLLLEDIEDIKNEME